MEKVLIRFELKKKKVSLKGLEAIPIIMQQIGHVYAMVL